MVGVPRSKGCVNCRRRKVACDQQKPACQVCLKRGDTCEGYDKYPVVLQWTPKGLMKRQRFEEVVGKPVTSQTPQTAGYRRQPGVKTESSSSGASTPRSSKTDESAISDFNGPWSFTALLPVQVHTGAFLLDQIEVRCMESYLPPNGAIMPEAKNSWMWSVMSMPDLGDALNSSFAALCLARAGNVMRDKDLISQGRGQYGAALVSLRKAIYNPETAFLDTTLAAMRTLSIYELMQPTTGGIPCGFAHELGMIQWCRAAGPRSMKTDFGLRVFQDVRWSIMNHSIEKHKSSILGGKAWLTVPWRHSHKSILEYLYDFGFEIAACLEQNDLNDGTPEYSTALATQVLTTLDQLDFWYAKHWSCRDPNMVISLESGRATPFQDLFEASNMLYYWWFQLLLYQILTQLSQDVLFVPVLNYSLPSSRKLDKTWLGHRINQLALNILLAGPYFLGDDTGWVGPQRMVYPLEAAMKHFGEMHSPLFDAARQLWIRLKAKTHSGR